MSDDMEINNDSVGVSCLSSGDNDPAHYMLKVESFSLLSEAGIDKYESDIFEANGYKWKLFLYPNGNDKDGGKNHISLYLVIVDTQNLPLGWEVIVYLRFFVYDHIRDNYLTIQGGMKMRFHSKKLEWGFSKLLSLNTFNDASSGYLFQDTCVFGVEVFVTPKFVLKENCLTITKPPTTSNSYTWTIDEFSEVFKVGNIKWKLVLYPKGVLNGKDTHLSIFLSITEIESLPLHWRIYAKYKLRVLDQVGTCHAESEVSHWFCKSSDNGYGFSSFLLLSDVKDKAKSYLVKD